MINIRIQIFFCIYLFCLLIDLIALLADNGSTTSNMDFDLPDLVTEWSEGTTSYRVDGFKENTNDKNSKPSLHRWVSLGLPRLIRARPAPAYKSILLIFDTLLESYWNITLMV